VELTLPAWSRTTKCANTCTTCRHAASCNHTHQINCVTPDMLVHAQTKIELSALSLHMTQGAHHSVLIRIFIPEGIKCSRLCHYVCTFGLTVGKGTCRIQITVFWDVMDHNFVLGHLNFGRTHCVHLHSYAVWMEAACSFKVTITTC
jgi:hypothetical protein